LDWHIPSGPGRRRCVLALCRGSRELSGHSGGP
jgi:hypothetical protein